MVKFEESDNYREGAKPEPIGSVISREVAWREYSCGGQIESMAARTNALMDWVCALAEMLPDDKQVQLVAGMTGDAWKPIKE